MPPAINPTPYPYVNAAVKLLLTDVKAILGDYFVGLYLHGSLALGDFNPDRSDIDFLVVTTRKLAKKIIPRVEKMHANIRQSGLKLVEKMEGAYLTKNAIRRYKPDNRLHLDYEDKLFFARNDSNWVINLHVIREHGIVIAGPEPKTLIGAVSPAKLGQAARDILVTWWAPMINNSDRMQSGPGYPAYAVDTMCRILYTLHHGEIVSKPTAARWALQKIERCWSDLVKQATTWKIGQPPVGISEAQQFIKYTLDKAERYRD